ncbi:MAG: TlyA family RNA methyltransferase [Clostridia bacterium]|nr:TlyA family RNA methyltransferase [Clostridia bacterium]
MRLDLRLTELGLAKSRTRAQSLIAGGFVTVNGVPVTKPSHDVGEDDAIVITGEEHPFVGRGGMKLESALDRFGIDPAGLVCADIGASTGGFTDCLLRHGAAKVWAVDAGHGQLDPTLRADPRVVNREGVNARTLSPAIIPEPVSLAVLDLSFISQTLVIPALVTVMTPDAGYVGLIKPQFECGREALGGGGIVRDKKQHVMAVRKVLASLDGAGLGAVGLMKSPVRGGDGNTEFLVYAKRGIPRTVGERETADAVQA